MVHGWTAGVCFAVAVTDKFPVNNDESATLFPIGGKGKDIASTLPDKEGICQGFEIQSSKGRNMRAWGNIKY
jgi:hypothetical protein